MTEHILTKSLPNDDLLQTANEGLPKETITNKNVTNNVTIVNNGTINIEKRDKPKPLKINQSVEIKKRDTLNFV